MRGAWGDFAGLCSREGVGGEPLQLTLVPQYWGVSATGRGRQCSLWGAKGCLLVGKRRREVAWLGGNGAPVFICAWEVCLKCAAPGEASGAPHCPQPPPQPPPVQGWHGWAQGAGAPAQGRMTIGRSPLESREKFGGVAAVVVCAGREVASGDLGRRAGRRVGGWAGGAVHS